MIWSTFARYVEDWLNKSHALQPDIIVWWHKAGFRRYWTWKSRRIGRPAIEPKLRKLIREMPAQSLACGAPRIDGELLKIDSEVSQATVSKYMRRHRVPPSQSWRTSEHDRRSAGTGITSVGRFGAKLVWLFLLASSPSVLAFHPLANTGPPQPRALMPAQYRTSSIVCDEMRQRLVVSNKSMNDRLRNFFLFDAAERGCIELMGDVLANGASVAARDRFGNTALLRAAHGGKSAAVKFLIDKSSDVNHQNVAGSTALLRAVNMNRGRTSRILLQAKADSNKQNRRNVSPLIAAAFNGNVRLVKLLIEAGARSDLRDATGKGALVYAAAKGYAQIITMLLDSGLGVDETYAHGLTPLMWAAGHTNDVPVSEGQAAVKLLLGRGATLGLVDDRGRTALMIAAERGHAELTKMLLDAGARRERRDAEGKKAADLAADDRVRELLRAH